MIQFNLLPDVKINYLKAIRTRNLIITISAVVVAVCLLLIGLLALNVYGVQQNHIANVTDDIDDYEEQISEINEINRILTVQNQLGTVNNLHDEKPVATRLFGYLEQVTPSDINLNRVEIDMESATMSLSGQTDSLVSVNRFVDTLKFTNIVEQDDEEQDGEDRNDDEDSSEDERFAFFDVVLDGFSRNPNETTFVINLSFDTTIFDSQDNVLLEVPSRITTRSEVDRPTDLFQAPESAIEEIEGFDL